MRSNKKQEKEKDKTTKAGNSHSNLIQRRNCLSPRFIPELSQREDFRARMYLRRQLHEKKANNPT